VRKRTRTSPRAHIRTRRSTARTSEPMERSAPPSANTAGQSSARRIRQRSAFTARLPRSMARARIHKASPHLGRCPRQSPCSGTARRLLCTPSATQFHRPSVQSCTASSALAALERRTPSSPSSDQRTAHNEQRTGSRAGATQRSALSRHGHARVHTTATKGIHMVHGDGDGPRRHAHWVHTRTGRASWHALMRSAEVRRWRPQPLAGTTPCSTWDKHNAHKTCVCTSKASVSRALLFSTRVWILVFSSSRVVAILSNGYLLADQTPSPGTGFGTSARCAGSLSFTPTKHPFKCGLHHPGPTPCRALPVHCPQ
jgi:hypothetical protein